jgi:hypothetical protein
MLRNIDYLTSGYTLTGKDGDIRRCKDFLFDDRYWTIRYMVADTGKWLPGRKVLISPVLLGKPDWLALSFPVDLTKEQIENSPPVDEHAPVSVQQERKMARYYGMPYYWTGGAIWGEYILPLALRAVREQVADTDPNGEEKDRADHHLRSTKEVIGYHIQATDGQVGHVEDFIVEDDTWRIRYLVVDTRNWLPGRKVILSPLWAVAVDWPGKKVHVDITREKVKSSPKYDSKAPLQRRYEAKLFDHYGRRTYWE